VGRIATVATTDPDKGGADSLTTGKDDDLVIGGTGADTINAGAGDNVVLGDNGKVTLAADGTPQVVEATDPTLGGIDLLRSEAGNDLVIGGTGGDTIDTGAGNDLVFGDFGKVQGAITLRDLPLNTSSPAFTFASIATQNADAGSDDFIRAGAGHDIVIGGQGADRILGEEGDDDIIGGHNVASGDDAGDTIDAGSGRDVIAGDNASIDREPRVTGARWRALSGSGLLEADGNGAVTNAWQADPAAAPQRDVTLFDHAEITPVAKYGSDQIAGGADDDMIFGQLGNDGIQGDGAVLSTAGNVLRDVRTTRLSQDDAAGTGRDGDDYIEGNGGDDVILGNLGQDDIIGGSSDLFGLATAAQQPDGRDVIYGGSGTRAARNDRGDLSADGHARDADVILGDNGRIFRVVGLNGAAIGGYLQFNYDTYGGLKVVPRTIVYLGYAFGQASNTALNDEIHGEAGDDAIHGMSGNDALFGDGQDDDIVGGQGDDRMSGGTGEDGMLGDDGRIFTSRNGLLEPVHGVLVAATQGATQLQGTVVGVVTNLAGRLKKSVDLAAFYSGGHDVMYGGEGDDFMHGGAGDDAMSGAEAQAAWYVTSALSGSVLGYDATTRKFRAYDATDALKKIPNFILNFDAANGGVKIDDGMDNLFGNEGNDWLVGGTGRDRMFGGAGDDLLNADDNLDTAGGLNNTPDAPAFADADWAFGGIGFDVLVGNTGADRLIDWSKRFNTYVLPIAYTTASPTNDAPTVIRDPSAAVVNLLLALAQSGGYDADINARENALRGELGLVTVDGDWTTWSLNMNRGIDRDPPPRNVTARIDTLGGWEVAPGIVIDASSRAVAETGTSQTVRVSLAAAPATTVVITVTSANPREVAVSRSTLTFTPQNWNVPQAVSVTGVDDAVADGATTTLVTIGVDRANSDIFYTVSARTVVVTNADNELSVPTITGPAATTALARPTVTWTAIPGAASYEVRLMNVTTKQVQTASTVTNTFMPAADLGIGLYEVAVRAIMPGGLTHAWSIVRRFQVETAVIMPPPGDFNTQRPTLRWNTLAGAVRYEVVVTNARNAVVAQAASVTGTAWTPPQNLAKGTYRLTVRGYDAAGRAALWSLPAPFQIK
jgi:Ca2+-binding RTX toxin-like protein